MKKSIIGIGIIISLILCACEADKSLPLFLHGDIKQIYDETELDKSEFSEPFIKANYFKMEPLEEEEEFLFGEKKNYISCSLSEALAMREALYALIGACYNHNYPYTSQLKKVEHFLAPNLYNQLIKNKTVDTRREMFEKYEATSVIESIHLLPYDLVCVYGEQGDETYRLWVSIDANHDAKNNMFFDISHYVKGNLYLELYIYFKYDEAQQLKIVAWDEVNRAPDLEVIYTENGIYEATTYENVRLKHDSITPATLTAGFTFIDIVEFPLFLRQRILSLTDALVELPTLNNSEQYEEILDHICTANLITNISKNGLANGFEDEKKLYRVTNKFDLFIYSKGNQEYLFATVLYSSNDAGINDSAENGKYDQLLSLTCVLLPLDHGEFLIDQYLLKDVE